MKVIDPLCRQAFSIWLDAFRWIAATIVVLSHAGGIIILPLSYVDVADRPPLQFAYSFVTGFAHYGVMIFFVMSGYLVGASWLRSMNKEGRNFPVYISKRIIRLGTVLFPLVLITPLLMNMGQSIYPGESGNGIYTERALTSIDPRTLSCNMMFLQNIICSRAGGNDALWSLTHEFWYYVAFPLLFFGWWGRGLALLLLGSLTLLQTSNVPIMPYFIIWLLGVGVAVAPYRKINLKLAAGIFVCFLVMARVIIGRQSGLTSHIADLAVGLSFSNLLWAMKSANSLALPPVEHLHSKIAGFSYTLYCTHMPALFLFSSVSMRLFSIGHRNIPVDFTHWLILISGIAFSFIFAFLFSLITEANTERVRRACFSFLARKERAL